MPEAPRLRPVTTLRIHCPVAPETLAALAAGDGAAVERDGAAAAVLTAIRAAGLGDFGRYAGVMEVAPAIEIFTPGADARPAVGRAGVTSHVPAVIITTWADAGWAGWDAALAAIAAAHPWEVPVIELSESRLLA